MRFRDVTGQEELKQILRRSAGSERIAHAQLFQGPEGSGMLPLALAFASYLLCERPDVNDSCGECASCRMTSKLAHPDLHLSFPFSVKKEFPDCDALLREFRDAVLAQPYMAYHDWMELLDGENKQGIIPVKESENILRKLSLKSFAGRYKIQVIWLPEKMNTQAANKLLKLLEEPPESTLFLLVTEHEEQLLRTIVSRTQSIKGDRLPDEEVKNYLLTRTSLSEKEAENISRLAAGNLRDALFIASEGNAGEDNPFARFRDWMRLCYKGDVPGIQKWVLRGSEFSRESLKGFLVYSLHMIRESLVLNYGDEKLVHLSGEEMDFLRKFSAFIHKGNCRKMMEDLNEAAVQLEWNANAKILLTDLSLRLRDLLKVPDPGTKIKA
ncbi:MAG: hypothetical protein IT233_03890 [Bacteroidia bacterium]|nr:hypothetical protein [Bacteroidia bacterium]